MSVQFVKIKPNDKTIFEGVPNFELGEFYTKSKDYTKDQIFIDQKLLYAAQTIRNFLDRPVYINSSARTQLHQNTLSGGAKNSQHVNENFENTGFLGTYAIDLDTDEEGLSILAGQFLEKGPLYDELVNIGIKCFGVYNNFIHIDTGMKPGATRNQVVVYSKRNAPYLSPSGYNKQGFELNIEENEDGIKDKMIGAKYPLILLAIIILLTIVYRKKIPAFLTKLKQWIF